MPYHSGIFLLAYLDMNHFYKAKHTILFLLAGLITFISCYDKRPKPDIAKLILSLKETGILITTDYTVSKVIRASDDQTWYKIGNRKILINCEANLKAGINLQNISESNIEKENDSALIITLPHAAFFSLSIPPGQIQVAYQDVGAFRDKFSAGEREQLIAQAEPQIMSLVASLGILQTAESNATVFMQRLFQQAGFKQVSVRFK